MSHHEVMKMWFDSLNCKKEGEGKQWGVKRRDSPEKKTGSVQSLGLFQAETQWKLCAVCIKPNQSTTTAQCQCFSVSAESYFFLIVFYVIRSTMLLDGNVELSHWIDWMLFVLLKWLNISTLSWQHTGAWEEDFSCCTHHVKWTLRSELLPALEEVLRCHLSGLEKLVKHHRELHWDVLKSPTVSVHTYRVIH